MKRREFRSLVISSVLAVITLAVLAWLLTLKFSGTSSSRTIEDDSTDVLVNLEQAAAPTISDPSLNNVAFERESVATPANSGDLSTESTGSKEQTKTADRTNPSESERDAKSDPIAATTNAAALQPESDSGGPQQQTVIQTSDPNLNETPSSALASEAGAGTNEQLSNRGSLPPFQYFGELEALHKQFPRLDAAWIFEASATKSSSEPGVLIEVVLDSKGNLCWENLRTNRRSPGFESATLRYNREGLVRVAEPARLQIWTKADEIEQLAGQAITPQNIAWGQYRHQREVYQLGRVSKAFHDAANRGGVQFNPQQRDLIEVFWGFNEKGDVCVATSSFVPQHDSKVPLPLDLLR